MKCINIIVSGKVQGVFYRNFIKQHCSKAGIRGYVKNKRDGTVEIIAEVDADQEKELMRQCWKGPMTAFIQKVDVQEIENKEEFDGFDIR